MSSAFNKKLIKSCLWCEYGKKSEYSDEVFCLKHGVTTKRDYCHSYKYDPLKRTPDKTKPDGNFTKDDFLL